MVNNSCQHSKTYEECIDFYVGYFCKECFTIEINEINCEHEYRFVLCEKANKTTELRNICIKCFEFEQKGYKKINYDVSKLEVRTLDYLNDLRHKKYNYRTELLNKLNEYKTDYFNSLKFYEDLKYQKYLKSEQWQEKRKAVLQRDNYRCTGCGIVRATEVHHLTYAHKYDEFLFELTSLCSECHRKYHNK